MTPESVNPHPEGLTSSQEEFIRDIFGYCIHFGEFRLKVHDYFPELPPSPIYINLRMLQADPVLKYQAVEVYEQVARNISFDLITGIPYAALPVASSLQDRLQVPMVTYHPPKFHGVGGSFDGMKPEFVGRKVLLVDDLVSQAKSKVEMAARLREEGLVVEDVVVLVDREQGGKEELNGNGLGLHCAFSLNQMIRFYRRIGLIGQEKFEQTLNLLAQLNRSYQKVSQ